MSGRNFVSNSGIKANFQSNMLRGMEFHSRKGFEHESLCVCIVVDYTQEITFSLASFIVYIVYRFSKGKLPY